MTIRNTATMLDRILGGLVSLLPPTTSEQPAPAWAYEDCSWYSSSFELARGLEVIEHPGVPAAVFSDTLPAYHLPRA